MTKRRKIKPVRSPQANLPPLSGDYNQSLITFSLQSGRFGAEINMAKREFWGANIPQLTMGIDPSMIFWADWFIYCRPLKIGLTPLQTFFKAYQGELSPADEAAYRKLEESVFGVFEVERVQRDRSVTVRDLRNPQEYDVAEKRATRQLKADGITECARVPNSQSHGCQGKPCRFLKH